MDTNPYRLHLDRLIRHGRELRGSLTTDPADGSTPAGIRIWQRDVAALVNQLSGGVKAHWLSRAFSQAFLIRSTAGSVVVQADVAEIVDRLLAVLTQAGASLSRMRDGETTSSEAAPPTHRFDFVHNADLRPVLEQAYLDSRRAFDGGDFHQALILSSSVLEAIITDALRDAEHTGAGLEAGGELSFDTRIAAAERAGLIHGGCARLPRVARSYRDLTDAAGDLLPDVTISEREARLTGQVLRVVMRDLDPGR